MKFLSFTVGCLLGVSSYAMACTTGIDFKVDRVTLNSPSGASSSPTTINFRQAYSTVPLVFILPSNDNVDPSTVRVFNVTTTSFQVGTAESEGEDGFTTAQDFNYLAIEPGSYNLGGGVRIQAGTISTTQRQSGAGDTTGYATANFSPSFGASAPIVLHEVQSFTNDPTYSFNNTTLTQPWLETISLQGSATGNDIPIALERAETSAGSVSSNETIAWFAMTEGTGSFTDNSANTINYNTFFTVSKITHNCTNNVHGLGSASTIAIASQSSRNGGNGGWLRLCGTDTTNLSMRIEEDRANDAEQSHTSERATIAAFSQAFDVSAAGATPNWEAASATVNAQNLGSNLNFTSVNFARPFQTTPLIFTLPTTQGSAPASVRFKNISTTGFQVTQIKPQGETGPSPSMTIDYIAITPGTHAFPNGSTLLEAGTINTSTFQGNNVSGRSYTTLTFNNTFASNPAFLLSVQSINSEPGMDPENASSPWLETTVQSGSITTNSASITMERAGTSNGTVSSETIAYLAAETNTNDTIITNSGSVLLKIMTTADNIQGFDNGCFNNNYNDGGFPSIPFVVAQQLSRDGSDGGWLRRCNISSTQIGLLVDEDRADDGERGHTTEIAAVFAFEKAFEWCPPSLNLAKNSRVIRDPANGTNNPKALPGALQRYELRLNNEGVISLDNNAVTLTDTIPTNTSMFVQSSVLYPEIPFTFTDGTGATASGLSFVYLGASSNTDDVEFSQDNGADGFTYLPTPDSDGFDSNVTDVRLKPKGVFNGSSGANIPTFTLDFSVRVD